MSFSPDISKPLHVEIVTDTYTPDINGVANTLGRLGTGLRARGHRVEIVRSNAREGEIGVPWLPLPGYWEIKVGTPWPGQLRRRWQKQRPDVVYAATETFLGLSATRAACKLGIPVIGGFHTNFREYLRNYGVSWLGEITWKYQRWFHERLNLTLVPSPDVRANLLQSGFSKVALLGRGVDTALFHPSKRSESLRKQWGATEKTPVALVVGRVSTEKNIQLALRAFEQMKAKQPDLIAIVIGDGPARTKLEAAHPHALFPGYQTGETLAASYASADVMLFPSETETFGNVLLEGMASGLATLSYDYAAAGWHGKNGENCLKVPKSDEDAFLSAAISLLDPDLRRRLGSAALETAESLGWPAIVEEVERIFKEVAFGSAMHLAAF